MSHPTWVRGLKHKSRIKTSVLHASHPTWVRGLKPTWQKKEIEQSSRTLRGCVD